MTRKLECKAAARLLKNAFAAKGAALTHTEALDILARLEGYEAWSHMKAAERKKPNVVETRRFDAAAVLLERFGAWHDFEAAPRSDWQYQVDNGDTNRGYYEWLAYEWLTDEHPELAHTTFQVPQIRGVDSRGNPVVWDIESDLSDRWGDLNFVQPETKPGLIGLVLQPALLEQLRELMQDEYTFIVCKDGKYGLLFEVEYMCEESDRRHPPESDTPDAPLPARAEVVTRLQLGLQALEKDFPGVDFCVPPEDVVFIERPAVWAFVPAEAAAGMGADKRAELARRMDSI